MTWCMNLRASVIYCNRIYLRWITLHYSVGLQDTKISYCEHSGDRSHSTSSCIRVITDIRKAPWWKVHTIWAMSYNLTLQICHACRGIMSWCGGRRHAALKSSVLTTGSLSLLRCHRSHETLVLRTNTSLRQRGDELKLKLNTKWKTFLSMWTCWVQFANVTR